MDDIIKKRKKGWFDVLEQIIYGIPLTEEEMEIYRAVFTDEKDVDLGKRLGLSKAKIRSKRQNIHSKIGYRLMTVCKMLKEVSE